MEKKITNRIRKMRKEHKRECSIVIAAAIILCGWLAYGQSADAKLPEIKIGDISFNDTDLDGRYEINSDAQLNALRSGESIMENDTKSDAVYNFELTTDIAIDLRGGNLATSKFQGNLDGNGYTISIEADPTYEIIGSESETNVGLLFGTVSGTITNMFIDAPTVQVNYVADYREVYNAAWGEPPVPVEGNISTSYVNGGDDKFKYYVKGTEETEKVVGTAYQRTNLTLYYKAKMQYDSLSVNWVDHKGYVGVTFSDLEESEEPDETSVKDESKYPDDSVVVEVDGVEYSMVKSGSPEDPEVTDKTPYWSGTSVNDESETYTQSSDLVTVSTNAVTPSINFPVNAKMKELLFDGNGKLVLTYTDSATNETVTWTGTVKGQAKPVNKVVEVEFEVTGAGYDETTTGNFTYKKEVTESETYIIQDKTQEVELSQYISKPAVIQTCNVGVVCGKLESGSISKVWVTGSLTAMTGVQPNEAYYTKKTWKYTCERADYYLVTGDARIYQDPKNTDIKDKLSKASDEDIPKNVELSHNGETALPDEDRWLGYADLNVGAIAGLSRGAVTECRQVGDVTALLDEEVSDAKDNILGDEQNRTTNGMPQINVGNLVGKALFGTIRDNWIQGKTTAGMNTEAKIGNIVGYSNIPIEYCIMFQETVEEKEGEKETKIIDNTVSANGINGTVPCTGGGSGTAANCYGYGQNNTGNPSYLSQDCQLENRGTWRRYVNKTTSTENQYIYVLSWLCRDVKFMYSVKNTAEMPEGQLILSVAAEEEAAEPIAIRDFHATLSGLVQVEEGKGAVIKPDAVNVVGVDKAETNKEIVVDIGNSGYFEISGEYARDDRYYYMKKTSDPQAYYIYAGSLYTEPVFTYAVGEIESDREVDYVTVTATQTEAITDAKMTSAVYHSPLETKSSDEANVVGQNVVEPAVVAASKESAAARIHYNAANLNMDWAYWEINNRIYPAMQENERPNFTLTNKKAVAAAQAQAVTYYQEGTKITGSAEYSLEQLVVSLSTSMTNQCYDEQALTIVPNTNDQSYFGDYKYAYYLTSQADWSLPAGETYPTAESGMVICSNENNQNTYNIQISQADGSQQYLYVIRWKENYPFETARFDLNIGEKVDIVDSSVATNETVRAGQKITLTPSSGGSTVGFTGFRYMFSTSINAATACLHDLNGTENVASLGSTQVEVPENIDNKPTIYLFVQMYGTDPQDNTKVICGQMRYYRYVYQTAATAPTSDPSTTTEAAGDRTTIESGTAVELSSSHKEATIVYANSSEKLTAVMASADETASFAATEKEVMSADNAFVKVDDIWYKIPGGTIYDKSTGIVMTNATTSPAVACISAMTLADGYLPSESVQYYYNVNQIGTASVPEASLKDGEASRYSYLMFTNETPDVQMYYTTNGTEPQKGSSATSLYDEATGIRVTGQIGDTFTVKIYATKEDENGNKLLNDSAVCTVQYTITEEVKADVVTSVPQASTEETPITLIPGDKILLLTSTVGANIYYSTDGEPTVVEQADGSWIAGANTILYDDATGIKMPEDGSGVFTVNAIAAKTGISPSEVTSMKFFYPDAVLAPYATPTSGRVSLDQVISLVNRTEGATIYYEVAYGTQEAADPTLSSPIFDGGNSITITRETKIKAMAVLNGVKSSIVSFSYTPTQQLVAPVASVASGSVVPNGTTMTFSVPKGATAYYTMDSSSPTDASNSAVMSGTTVLLQGEPEQVVTIKACTKKANQSTSEVAVYTYKISKYQGGVTVDMPSGSNLTNGDKVNILTDVTDATVYYSTNGSDPVAGGVTGLVVTVNSTSGTNVTLKAVACPDGGTVKTIALFTYKLNAKPSAPSASPESGILTTATEVTLSAGAGTIYYTLDGSDPSSASFAYTQPIILTRATTIKAVVISDTGEVSDVATFTYTTSTKAAKPVADAESGELAPSTVVKLSTATAAARIYYSTDGTTPTLNNYDGMFVYGEEGITVNRSVTIKAVAYAEGLRMSDVAEYSYLVTQVPADEAMKQKLLLEEEQRLRASTTSELADRRAAYTVSDNNTISGNSYMDVVISEKTYGTEVAAKSNVISRDCKLKTVKVQASENIISNVKAVFGQDYTILGLYDLRVMKDEMQIDPSGNMQISMPIPEGFANAAITIVYVNSENQQIQKLETVRKGETAYATTTHMSYYALVGMDTAKEKSFNINFIYVVIGISAYIILFVIGYGVFTIFRVRRRRAKRKKSNESQNYPNE